MGCERRAMSPIGPRQSQAFSLLGLCWRAITQGGPPTAESTGSPRAEKSQAVGLKQEQGLRLNGSPARLPPAPLHPRFVEIGPKEVEFETGTTLAVQGFRIGRYPVTIGDFESFTAQTGY